MSYIQTFVIKSDDCPTDIGERPGEWKSPRTKAQIEYDLLLNAPYTLDHDALNYTVYATQCAEKGTVAEGRAEYLSKGRPCMRASALVKRYVWGAHYDDQGRIAIYPADGADYARLAAAPDIKVLKGMRSSRA